MCEKEDMIILFDGVCNLCGFMVSFVIRRDPKTVFHFAALQSEKGQSLLKGHQMPIEGLDSVVVIKNGKMHVKSNAALMIARHLQGLWPLLYIFIFIPTPIRDGVYAFVARNRYRWFGRKDACLVPTPEIKRRFL